MARYAHRAMIEKMMDSMVTASDELVYAVAYRWEVHRSVPPWWAVWRKPIVTRTEVLQPGRMEGRFEKGEDRDGNPEVVFKPVDPNAVPWDGVSKISIVNEAGIELGTQEF